MNDAYTQVVYENNQIEATSHELQNISATYGVLGVADQTSTLAESVKSVVGAIVLAEDQAIHAVQKTAHEALANAANLRLRLDQSSHSGGGGEAEAPNADAKLEKLQKSCEALKSSLEQVTRDRNIALRKAKELKQKLAESSACKQREPNAAEQLQEEVEKKKLTKKKKLAKK